MESDGISKSTVRQTKEGIEQLEPYGKDRLEILDYLDNQRSLNIQMEDKVPKKETSFTPEVLDTEVYTKYITVQSQMKDSKDSYKRKIKLILVDHFHDRGIPCQIYAEEEVDEEDQPEGR